MKHTSWLSGLSAVRSPSRAAWARTSLLVISPTGNTHAGQLVLSQHGQHVGLVLVRVGAPAEPERAVAGDPGVVPGGHGVEADAAGPLQQAVELEDRLHSMHGLGVRPSAWAST